LAFYSVIDKMRQAELFDKGSYNFAIYDAFGFKGDMYGPGIECGYKDLHDALVNDVNQDGTGSVELIEVIEADGNVWHRKILPDQVLRVSLQNNNQNLRIVIQPTDPV